MRLFNRGQFPHPSAYGAGHYVPILQGLGGELQALRHIPKNTRGRVTPLVEVSPEREDVDDAPRASRLTNLHSELGRSLGEAPFFLDFRRLNSRKRIAVGQGNARHEVPAMAHVIEQCNANGLNFVPVLYPGIDARRISLLKESIDDGRGVCVRIPLGLMFEATPMADEVEQLLDAVKGPPSCADLLIDLGFIDREPGYDGRDLIRALERVPRPGDWRSLILAGTVIPILSVDLMRGASRRCLDMSGDSGTTFKAQSRSDRRVLLTTGSSIRESPTSAAEGGCARISATARPKMF